MHPKSAQASNGGRLLRRHSLALVLLIALLVVPTSGCTWFDKVFSEEDPIERTEWAFEKTGIVDLNERGYFGEGVTIGIVDTGVDLSHPDLRTLEIVGWLDLVDGRTEPYDDNGHGTSIVGLLGADGDLRGAAPRAQYIVVKAIGADGSGSDAAVGDGIRYCTQAGVDILVLSLGGQKRRFNLGDESAQAAQDAVDEGVIVVSSAGNDGENDDGDVSSPAHIEGVIAVGAIDANCKIAVFSSRGDNDGQFNPPWPFPDPDDREDPNKKPECVAPGVEIVSTYIEKQYASGSGTSQAAAIAGGAIALVLDAKPSAIGSSRTSVTEFKSALMDSAEPCPSQETPHDNRYGYGLIDGPALVQAL